MDIISLILGAVLGVAFTELYEKVILKYITNSSMKKYQKMRTMLYRDPQINNFILNYYIEQNAYNDLFNFEVPDYSGKLLFLTDHVWSNLRIDIFRSEQILHFVNSKDQLYEVNNKMLEKRKKHGQNLFNGDCLILSRVLEPGRIEVKKCSFYEKLTLIDHLETETYKASRRKHHDKLKYRDQIIKDFQSALSTNNLPVSMGCHVILALNLDGKIWIAFHRRSEKTFTYGGYIASIPVFGLVPIPSSRNTDNNKNILLYNILKEYCEELFDRTILQRQSNYASPFWFYDQFPEATALIKSLQENTSECLMLGYGFDAINGLSIIASLLYIADETLAKNIYDSCQTNWEVEGHMRFCSLDDPSIKENFEKSNYENGTAFALSLAINYLKEL